MTLLIIDILLKARKKVGLQKRHFEPKIENGSGFEKNYKLQINFYKMLHSLDEKRNLP
jgi:hypothetical protein